MAQTLTYVVSCLKAGTTPDKIQALLDQVAPPLTDMLSLQQTKEVKIVHDDHKTHHAIDLYTRACRFIGSKK